MITKNQLNILRDAINESHQDSIIDKISLTLDTVTRTVIINWWDFDDEDFRELSEDTGRVDGAPENAVSEWYFGERKIESEQLVPIRERWLCPKESCTGEMRFNGAEWPTQDPGYHHTCTVCQHTVAVKGDTYPRIVYIKSNNGSSDE